ncbi:MAG: hypothetical protein PUB32_04630 [Clostridiales bacterium]|nr:hypothetical protein [Clostridiales bacterium]
MAAKRGMSERAARAVLNMKLPEDSPLREELEQHGLAATGAQAIFFALYRKAAAGDVSAAKLIREAAGEKAADAEPVRTAGAELAGLSDDALREMIGAGE